MTLAGGRYRRPSGREGPREGTPCNPASNYNLPICKHLQHLKGCGRCISLFRARAMDSLRPVDGFSTPQLPSNMSLVKQESGFEAGPDPIALLRSLRARLKLSRENLARLLGCSPRALSYWESETQRPKEGTTRSIVETARLVGALSTVAPGELGEWLFQPLPDFGGLKPIEVIERGESGRLWAFVFQSRAGVRDEAATV